MYRNYSFAEFLKKPISIPYNIISMSYNDMQTGPSIPHSHHSTEIMVIIGGEGVLTSREQTLALKPNKLYVVNPNTEHTEHTKTFLKYYVLKFDNFVPYNQDKFSQVNAYPMPYEKYKQFLGYLSTIQNELLYPTKYSTEIIISHLSCLYYFCTNFLEQSHTYVHHKPIDNKVSSRTQSIVNYISSHYSEEIVMSELAQKFAFSHNNLIRVFKKETGYSPRDYLIKVRLDSAANLLKNTDYSVSQIALQTGFPSPAFFSKSFRCHFSLTPSDYRRIYKKTLQ